MRRPAKSVLVVSIFISSLIFGACSSSSSSAGNGCPAAGLGHCSADPEITPGEVSGCNQDLADPKCGSIYQEYLDCYNQHVTCNAQNQTDVTALSKSCGTLSDDFTTCVKGPADGG